MVLKFILEMRGEYQLIALLSSNSNKLEKWIRSYFSLYDQIKPVPPTTPLKFILKIFTLTIYLSITYCPEKAMAPRSGTLSWKIPWTEEPGGLQSMGSLRVGHNWATSLSLFTFMHWRRKWQPTPVFLPGESQGRGSLVGYHLWGRTESDTTEAT